MGSKAKFLVFAGGTKSTAGESRHVVEMGMLRLDELMAQEVAGKTFCVK